MDIGEDYGRTKGVVPIKVRRHLQVRKVGAIRTEKNLQGIVFLPDNSERPLKEILFIY